jgi:flagellar biosynthesis protein FlhB
VAENKTEKATPKKREEARKKGQVARSADVNGAAILMAGLLALSAFGPKMMDRMEQAMLEVIARTSEPDKWVTAKGLGSLFVLVGQNVGLAALPVIAVCAVAGLAAGAGQVGLKPSLSALKPDPKRLNPMSGFKNIFGPNMAAEAAKSIGKVAVVGAIAFLAVFPKINELGALVGTSPADLIPQIAHTVLGIAQRAAVAYLVIAACDYLWQRHRHEKSLKMDKEEIKQEFKQQGLPAEIKSAQRRRAMELARARMMDAVPSADVIVTNPTHYSVALKYDSGSPAPIVVAKGVDNLAFKIREIANANGVMIVPDPPLARTLYASVDVGKQIPEDLFHAVAQLLAYVYRVAGARKQLAAA